MDDTALTVAAFDYQVLAPEVARQVRVSTNLLKSRYENIRVEYWRIGHELDAVKALLDHGQWLSWLEAEAQIAERSAQRMIKISQSYTLDEIRSAEITISALTALTASATPDDLRDELLTAANSGQPVTRDDVKAAQVTRGQALAPKITGLFDALAKDKLSIGDDIHPALSAAEQGDLHFALSFLIGDKQIIHTPGERGYISRLPKSVTVTDLPAAPDASPPHQETRPSNDTAVLEFITGHKGPLFMKDIVIAINGVAIGEPVANVVDRLIAAGRVEKSRHFDGRWCYAARPLVIVDGQPLSAADLPAVPVEDNLDFRALVLEVLRDRPQAIFPATVQLAEQTGQTFHQMRYGVEHAFHELAHDGVITHLPNNTYTLAVAPDSTDPEPADGHEPQQPAAAKSGPDTDATQRRAVSIDTAREYVIDQLRKSQRPLMAGEISKWAGINLDITKQALAAMVEAGNLVAVDDARGGQAYHYAELVQTKQAEALVNRARNLPGLIASARIAEAVGRLFDADWSPLSAEQLATVSKGINDALAILNENVEKLTALSEALDAEPQPSPEQKEVSHVQQ